MQKRSLRNAFFVTVPFMIMLAGYSDEVARNAKTYGVRQIEQMCDDRPDMLDVFPPDHPIRRWCSSQFETGENGRRVVWDCSEPVLQTSAEHWPRAEGHAAAIRISQVRPSTGLDKWVMLVFEFHNIERESDRLRLQDALCRRKISLDQFAVGCTRSEFDALQMTIDFLERHGIQSLATKADVITLLLLNSPVGFDEFLERYDGIAEGEYDPREYFAEYGRRLLDQLNLQWYRNERERTPEE